MCIVTAIRFSEVFRSGHSCPCLVEVEDVTGKRDDVLVKLRDSVHGAEHGLACEFLGSLLAKSLGINVPHPFIVEVTSDFADSVTDESVRTRFRKNVGLNFGSELQKGQFYAFSYGQELPEQLMESAASVLLFDAMIQNPDRHQAKSNYLFRGSSVCVIDHELAFPFVRGEIVQRPWEPEGLNFIKNHVFFRALRGEIPDFDSVVAKFQSLDVFMIEAIVEALPIQWDKDDFTGRAANYLLDLQKHFPSVVDSVRILLR